MHYSRPNLTKKLGNQLINGDMTSIFLTAPRRTGKSTFVREDLRPFLENKNAIVVYADLWENKNVDPSEVISKAILRVFKEENAISNWFSGIDSVNLTIAGVGLGVQKGDQTVDMSITEALVELSDKTKKKIILIIDEVQHSLVSQKGENLLFALKAARDEVNSSKHYGMVVLGTGSNQDKLSSLRNSKDQAFYLTPLIKLPFLDKNYASWISKKFGFELDDELVWEMFERTGYKPEIINGVLRQMQLNFNLDDNINELFKNEVENVLEQERNYQIKKINELPTRQWAVLMFLSQNYENKGLFEKSSWQECERLAKYKNENIKFNSAQVQYALNALQDKGFLWNEKRGSYHIEDEQISKIAKDILTNINCSSNTANKRRNNL